MTLPPIIKKLLSNEKLMKLVRYLIIGVLTTGVSFSVFWVLCYPLNVEPNLSNIVSIICAIIFAYFTNKSFVFRSKTNTFRESLREAISFGLSRGFTIVVEVSGMFLLVTILRVDAMLSKVLISVLVIILNYVISQFFVFKDV